MKFIDLIEKIGDNAENLEVIVNNEHPITDVKIEDEKIIISFEAPLIQYYDHQTKIDIVKNMVQVKKLDNVKEISEKEVTEIATDLELSFYDVAKQFLYEDIYVVEV